MSGLTRKETHPLEWSTSTKDAAIRLVRTCGYGLAPFDDVKTTAPRSASVLDKQPSKRSRRKEDKARAESLLAILNEAH